MRWTAPALALALLALALAPAARAVSFTYNASGTFIEIPTAPPKIEFEGLVVSAWMPNASVVEYRLVCLLPDGCGDVVVEVRDPETGEVLANATHVNLEGSVAGNLTLPRDVEYAALALVYNGYEMGPYAVVPRAEAPPVEGDAQSVMWTALVVAPFLAALLRYRVRVGAMAAAGISLVYYPVLCRLGLPPPIPELLVTVVFLGSVALIAVSES